MIKLTDVDTELQKAALWFGYPSLDQDGFSVYERCDRDSIEGFTITRARICEIGRMDNVIEGIVFYALSKMQDYLTSDYARQSHDKVVLVGSRIRPYSIDVADDNWNVHLYHKGYRFFGHFRNSDELFYIWYPASDEWRRIAMLLKIMIAG